MEDNTAIQSKNDTTAFPLGEPSPCIAVLPFDNLSGSPVHDYFTEGVVEDILTDIAHFPNLRVISSYTSRKIGHGTEDTIQAARALGINYLLKCCLIRKKQEIRISAQLLNTIDGSILWAEKYDAAMDRLFDIQDDIVSRVVGAISVQIDMVLLSSARSKSLTSLAAYDAWLRGMEHLRLGTPAADEEARRIFQQALAIDPTYSRAYAGISLSYFNDWSCQLWEQWETTERSAYEYAQKAVRLDDTDYMVHLILGRILIYRRQFEQAEEHLDRSLSLNGNDADALVQIATGKAFLGKAKQGETLYLKAMRLNPYRNIWYQPLGALTYFAQRRYEECIQTALKGPLTDVWLDLPAYMAAAYAYTGASRQAKHYIDVFKQTFSNKITADRPALAGEIIDWMILANPFRHDADREHLVHGLQLAGLDAPPSRSPAHLAPTPPMDAGNRFQLIDQLWHITYGGKSIQLQDIKGLQDLARLLGRPGDEIHCAELMGNVVQIAGAETVIDEQARREYQARVEELREAIDAADAMNDPVRAERAREEYDRLTEHLSRALGLGGRARKENMPVERARAAVTWRIRSAINKIEAAHPTLGRHLTNAIRTGTFCSYTPETSEQWEC